MKPLSTLFAFLAIIVAVLYLGTNRFAVTDKNKNIPALNGAGPCTHPDYDALVALYNATNGPGWRTNQNWLDTCDVCLWTGIKCNASERVTAINLPGFNLSGELPPEIGDLSFLESLDLFNNNLSGSIPAELATLPLRSLRLRRNNLDGQLPSSLSNLQPTLDSLEIENNQFSGPFPLVLCQLTNLTFLSMENNFFSGPIPSQIENLQRLKIFYCGGMPITEIPAEIGNIPTLEQLYLSFSQISSIPPEIGNLQNLQEIYIEYNSTLAGTLPPEIGQLSNLQVFAVEGCNLVGEIPEEFSNLTSLQRLHLGSNHFSGRLPSGLGNLPNLQVLDVFENNLEGCIPETYMNLCSQNARFYFGYNPCLWQGTYNQFCAGAGCQFTDYTLAAAKKQICRGASTLLTTTGGSDFQWSTGENTSSIEVSPLSEAWYYLTLTTTSGCHRYDSIFIQVTSPPSLTLTSTDVSSPGANDGMAIASASNGQPPYSFQWNTGAGTPMINDLNAGQYFCTVTDVNGCTDQQSITVNEPACPAAGTPCDDGDPTTFDDQQDGLCNCTGIPCPTINLGLTGIDISCYGANDGQISASPSGGQSPYTLIWSDGSIGDSITGLIAGVYGVTVTDNHGCTNSETLQINEPYALQLTLNGSDETVPNAADGAIDLQVSGGTAPFQFGWNNGMTTEDLTNLSGDIQYTVTVTDHNGCQKTGQLYLETGCFPVGTKCDDGNPSTYDDIEDGSCHCSGTNCSLAVNTLYFNISCFNSNDGSARIEIVDGSAPFEIKWSTGEISSSIEDLSAGNYQVTVTDANACYYMSSFKITQPDALSLSLHASSETVPDAQDGIINLEISGGSLPYHYLWSTGATSKDLTALQGLGSKYAVTVTDSRGCMVKDSVVLETGCFPMGTSCDDGDEGTFNDTQDGNCNCSGISCPPFIISSTVSEITCSGSSDGKIILEPTINNSSYTYVWNNGINTNINDQLGAGIYIVTITDQNGCSNTQSFQLHDPVPLTIHSTITDATSFESSDGSIQIMIAGGTEPYKISWNDGQMGQIRTMLDTGTYSVTILDSLGCTSSQTFKVDALCTLTGVACDDKDPNTHNDTYNENCECIGTECPTLNVQPIIIIPKCAGDLADVSLDTFGLHVKEMIWSNGDQNQNTQLSEGQHFVTITRENQCVSAIQFSIDIPDSIEINLIGTDASNTGVADGSINTMITGGTKPYDLQWSTGSTSPSIGNLPGNRTYSITVTDANGCENSDSIYLAEFICAGLFEGKVEAEVNSPDLCTPLGIISIKSDHEFPDSTEFSIDGIFYQDSSSFYAVASGIYTPTLRSKTNGCILTLEPVVVQDLREYELWARSPTICEESTGSIIVGEADLEIALSAEGPWYRDSITDVAPGIYSIFGRMIESNCSQMLSTIELIPADFQYLINIETKDAVCGETFGQIHITLKDSNHLFSLDGGNRWYPNEQTFAVSPGIYEVLVKVDQQCVISIDTLQIRQIQGLVASISSVQAPSNCSRKDGSFMVIGAGLTYFSIDTGKTWTPEATFDTLGVGSYLVMIQDSSRSCLDTINISLTAEDDEHDIVIDELLAPTCFGEEDGYLKLSLSPPSETASWLWENGTTQPERTRLEAGKYEVRLSLNSFCYKDYSVSIADPEPIRFELPPLDSQLYCTGENIEIELPDTSLTYEWYKNDQLFNIGSEATIFGAGLYKIRALDSNSCESIKDFQINYSEDVFIPNFLLASAVEVGKPALAIEISWPVPDTIFWQVEGGTIVESFLNQSTMVFEDLGEHEIILTAMKNGCMSTVRKTIMVVEEGQIAPTPNDFDESIMLSLFPNPNLGNFNTHIVLSETSDLQIRIYSEEGMIVYSDQALQVDQLLRNIDLTGIKSGVYIMLVQSLNSWKTISFVIE